MFICFKGFIVVLTSKEHFAGLYHSVKKKKKTSAHFNLVNADEHQDKPECRKDSHLSLRTGHE